MDIYERNISVFQENRHLAATQFKKETESLLANTKVYTDPLKSGRNNKVGKCFVDFQETDTISAVLGLVRQGYKVCALNFADALTPGGLVYQGEVTQEEDLCRCTNLYESLVLPECIEKYYKYNSSLGSSIYSDRVIYSEGVTVLRESLHYSLLETKKPLKCDIVTCPAPIAFSDVEAYYNIIKNRIRGILRVVASHRSVNAIVLGAWGCGAFGGDATLVGKAFGEVIAEFDNFDVITFAIKSTRNDSMDNYSLFTYGFNSR